jgi:hypothetical protein
LVSDRKMDEVGAWLLAGRLSGEKGGGFKFSE